MTPIKNVVEERVIAERGDSPVNDGGWLVMWPDGTVREYVDLKSAKRGIERQARALQRRTKADAVLTSVEWRGLDVPEPLTN